MSEILVHNNGKYNFYMTISDVFLFESYLTLKQLKAYTKREYGNLGLRELEGKLERTHKKGTSSHMDKNLYETLFANRAGENEEYLTYEECIKRFLT